MKKTIALMLAMLFAVCAFATTAFADPSETTTTTTTTATTTEVADPDAPNDGFNTTTTEATTAAATTTTTAASGDTTTTTAKADETTTVADVTATLAPGSTAYEGQGDENSTTKKPAAVDSTIPSTGSGIVVPAIALAVLAAGTVAVIKTKKED